MSSPSPRFSVDGSPPTPTSPTSTRSGYPFPDALARHNTGNRYQPRRGSNASTISIGSIGGSLDIQPRRGSTVRETSQNAIFNLLQSPAARTGLLPHNQAPAGFKAPTTRDIPPVTLTNIPHVPVDNFRDYLNRIGPLLESFQRGRIESEQAAWLKKDKELEQTDRFAEVFERRFSRDGPMSPSLTRKTSTTTLLSPTAETPGGIAQPKRRSSAQYRRNRNEPTPLSTIPSVYLEDDFHLENPRTFDVVSERAEIVRPPPGTTAEAPNGAPRRPITTNAILQEKLSWYMDTVEVHLIGSISTASSGFFAALGSLKELQTEAEESVAKIQGLRDDLRRLDQDVAVCGLEVAAKKRRRANVGKLAEATRQVERVVKEVKRADELVEGGGFDEAADQMDRVGRLVCGHPETDRGGLDEDLIDLRPLKALQGLDSGLQDLQHRIGAGFAQRFTSILIADLRQHVERVPSPDTLKRWSRQRGIPPTYMETSPQLRQDLLSALKGLGRAKFTAPATTAYRDAVQREMKALIRRHLPSSTDDDADSMVSTATSTRSGNKLSQQEKSSLLARNLRAMDAEDAEKLLVNVYTAVGEALRRVSTQTKVLLDVTSSMSPASQPGSPPKSPGLGPRSPSLPSMDEQLSNRMSNGNSSMPRRTTDINVQDELSQALDMSSLLVQAVDAAQGQITKVLKVRNEQTIRLSTPRFLRYFTLNRLFADECEAVSGQGGLALKGIINAQISGFVQVLGTAETERIAGLLDADDWNAKDFAEKDDVLLQRVLSSMGKDAVEWSQAVRPVWEDMGADPSTASQPQTNGVHEATNGTATPDHTPTPAKATTAKPAYIDENRYILVRSATALLTTFDTFLALTSYFPSMTPAIATALLDVLRVFNSRSSQLILGAGATRVVGLKNITTKHLALASQALGFVVALVPYVRECVRRHLQAGSLGVLAEFDRTKRGFQEHGGQIQDKLVEIMTSRSASHVRSMVAASEGLAGVGKEGKEEEEGGEGKMSLYMETLTRETMTLQRVLSRYLSEFDLELIMRRIFETYREQWGEGFRQVAAGLGEAGGGEAGAAVVVRRKKRLARDKEGFEGLVAKLAPRERVIRKG
ncbi:hypothetical protein LTR35_001498 [Friedmanniomyces endolithicus]|uniref:Vacuolar protein sorting-associated protein 54 C-terminal domain-containing protein n=1 Tax=Friedmanniomyces endolithicus TaxID=329885 RepID=A0AAN6FAU1_9PEZI|nr:hypothetical protein LTR35_001498 [Friedmanniomyces endolithicus]KAK0297983.1 hypothetical protein LTS00_003522 [Friedmanniomyces endolithicus]KAK0310768.1 hypothetical protein LTR82_014654 [Friedmanniomyces endolithicus]KAK1018370.1 hypothetical protein LTR54_001256 [Friedmanniomyces endolithicus]